MPAKDSDTSKRRSKREDDSPRVKDKDKDRERPRSSKKHHRRQSTPERPKAADRDGSPDGSRLARSSMTNLPARFKQATMSAVPEMGRRASVGDSKISSYPAFSKEHSRETVRPKEEAGKSKISIITPDPTEGGRSDRTRHSRTPKSEGAARAPPSPPLTADEADLRRANSANSSRRSHESMRQGQGRRSEDLGSRPRLSHLRADATSPRKASRGEDSDSSAKTTDSSRGTARRYASGSQIHRDAVDRERQTSGKTTSSGSQQGSQVTTNSDSQATSIAPDQRSSSTPQATPATQQASRGMPNTASAPQHQTVYSPPPVSSPSTANPALSNGGMPLRPFSQSGQAVPPTPPFLQTPFSPAVDAPPPPPPPPMDLPDETPRVDYLLLNGGLPHVIPKSLISNSNQSAAQSYTFPRIPQLNGNDDAFTIFKPITSRLEDLAKVLGKNGSVAVATGYRSVARRLLDRLEHVFARNISSEKCHCVVCNTSPSPSMSSEEQDGVSWGEILELVSGRRELPQWPPFTFDPETAGLGISGKVDAPMQKLDPDVPDEFRQHYMRQNDKTKRSVQDWLESQTYSAPQPEPPTDVDDETLSFAMLTRLEPEKRPYFTALMKGQGILPDGRSPSPATTNGETENAVLDKTGFALQRLYRLSSRPRRPECTIYLLNNRHLHSTLATLAAISPAEWDILVSGRFDGFLWSGAESGATAMPSSTNGSRVPSRGPTPLSRTQTPHTPFNPPASRGTTPFSPLRNIYSPAGISRGATPFSTTSTSAGATAGGAGGPVQHDEETEIAVLSEVERAIYRDMELLEDAFEQVHQSAEALRAQLRSRAAGLMMAAQARRGSQASEVEVRIGTPGSAWSMGGLEEEVFDDGRSELAPDDSASNISFARRRRGKERRTPGLEEEGAGGTAAERRRRR